MPDEIVNQETILENVVSNDPQKQEVIPPDTSNTNNKVDEFKLPSTQEEYDNLVKAAVNKEKTLFLKELGVKSVKEYKEQVSKAQEALSQHEAIVKQTEEIAKEKESLSQQYETLKQTSVLDKLGVREEYREDMIKLARDKVTESVTFEAALKNIVDSKYQYTTIKGAVKIGAEKTSTDNADKSNSSELHKKYSWIK